MISVLMSVYNNERPEYLHRSLQSVWDEQTYKPKEIILVEDGPLCKELYEVIEVWKDKLAENMIVIKNETNLGLTKSLNKGLKYTKSEFIARMDTDDISHPMRFELQYNFLCSNPDIDVVGGALQEFNDENPCLNIRRYPDDSKVISKYICKASPLAHPTVMMRRRIFDQGLIYDDRFRTSQDLALWFDVLAAGYKISNVKEVTIYFRLSNDVYKRRNHRKAYNEFKIYMRGIYMLHGVFTFAYIYPICRLVFRLLPVPFIRLIYNSSIRKKLLSE